MKEFQAVGRDLMAMGLLTPHAGNLSVRRNGRVFITRTGSRLDRLTAGDVVETPLDRGKPRHPRASMELPTHLAIYEATTAEAVVHAHPASAVALSFVGNRIVPLDSEGAILLSVVPVIRAKRVVASPQVARKAAASLREHRIVVGAGLCAGLGMSAAWAQGAPVELTQADVTKLKTMDSSQWAVLGVRLGDSKEAALQTLQRISNIKVLDDAASGRIFVIAPPTSNSVVMSLKITQGLVTGISLLGGFGEWLQGDTRPLFRAFEDDSLRFKLLGREDQRETVQGGTKESPTLTVTYAYFKEGLLLVYAVKRSADGKQAETLREMFLIYPARAR